MIPHRIWIRTSMAAMIAISATFAIACNVPVFRYALERWRPDLCQVIVFHEEELTAQHEQSLQTLRKATIAEGGFANAEIIQNKAGLETDRGRKELWRP